jgi:hypothetical protein
MDDDISKIRAMVERIRSKREPDSDDAQELFGAVFALSTKLYLQGKNKVASDLESWVKKMMVKQQGE